MANWFIGRNTRTVSTEKIRSNFVVYERRYSQYQLELQIPMNLDTPQYLNLDFNRGDECTTPVHICHGRNPDPRIPHITRCMTSQLSLVLGRHIVSPYFCADKRIADKCHWGRWVGGIESRRIPRHLSEATTVNMTRVNTNGARERGSTFHWKSPTLGTENLRYFHIALALGRVGTHPSLLKLARCVAEQRLSRFAMSPS